MQLPGGAEDVAAESGSGFDAIGEVDPPFFLQVFKEVIGDNRGQQLVGFLAIQ